MPVHQGLTIRQLLVINNNVLLGRSQASANQKKDPPFDESFTVNFVEINDALRGAPSCSLCGSQGAKFHHRWCQPGAQNKLQSSQQAKP